MACAVATAVLVMVRAGRQPRSVKVSCRGASRTGWMDERLALLPCLWDVQEWTDGPERASDRVGALFPALSSHPAACEHD